MSLALERSLAALAHPRFVSALGDRREKAVPCALCARPTLAMRGPICLACRPERLCDCGADMGDDPHDADELGETQVCHSCCPTCNPSSEPTRRVSDIDGGVHPPGATGPDTGHGRACGEAQAGPAVDISHNQGEKQ